MIRLQKKFKRYEIFNFSQYEARNYRGKKKGKHIKKQILL